MSDLHQHTNRNNWMAGLTKRCPDCKGDGETYEVIGNTILTEDCPRCNGSGYVMESAND